jgi:Skp family chaperone for outer membrane proteins
MAVRPFFVAVITVIAALYVAGPPPASAQQKPVPVVVGVLDADGIMKDSKAFQSLMAQADKAQKQIKSDFDRQQKQFDDEGRTLLQQKDKLSADDIKKKKQERSKRANQQTQALNARQHNLDQGVAKGRAQIHQAMLEVVKDVAKAHGLRLVLTQSVTLYFDPSYEDISKEVKQNLDAKLPSLKLQQSSAGNAQ